MSAHRLVAHTRADAIVAYRDGRPVALAQFLADVERLARRLPKTAHTLNVCADRYLFAVGLAASMVRGVVSLLPPATTPELVRQLLRFAPDLVCLTDRADETIALPLVQVPRDAAEVGNVPRDVPLIDAAQTVAYVFTSGSTGAPVPHAKTWGPLVRNVRAEAATLGIAADRPTAIVGTVPSQHMYGFESTVWLPLQCGAALCAQRPFYPADICSVLESLPRPRVLVTTPYHLSALLDAVATPPAADLVVSATAPLSQPLAVETEARFRAPLLEIYGATEAGQMAARRTAQTDVWETFPGLALREEGGRIVVSGGHVENEVALSDVMELVATNRFRLLGRAADMVNIAGKRSSIGYLNHHLTAIRGVRDGTFYMPEDRVTDGVTRLAAFIVAPGLTAQDVVRALRERVDPAFLPRPVIFLDALPRNATGKLPREALDALARRHLGAGSA